MTSIHDDREQLVNTVPILSLTYYPRNRGIAWAGASGAGPWTAGGTVAPAAATVGPPYRHNGYSDDDLYMTNWERIMKAYCMQMML